MVIVIHCKLYYNDKGKIQWCTDRLKAQSKQFNVITSIFTLVNQLLLFCFQNVNNGKQSNQDYGQTLDKQKQGKAGLWAPIWPGFYHNSSLYFPTDSVTTFNYHGIMMCICNSSLSMLRNQLCSPCTAKHLFLSMGDLLSTCVRKR